MGFDMVLTRKLPHTNIIGMLAWYLVKKGVSCHDALIFPIICERIFCIFKTISSVKAKNTMKQS